VNDPAFVICNSVGGIVGLQAALAEPEKVRGLLLLNVSLRMLHIKKQGWFMRPFVKGLQNVLR
jgi:pimeloyl-ACP methyl ester carboxylesterase